MDVEKTRLVELTTGIVAMLCAGAIYTWSVFGPTLQAEFGWNASQTSLVFTFTIFFLNVGGFLAGQLAGRLDRRTIMTVGAMLLLVGISGSSFTSSHLSLVVSFGLITGLGCGLMSNTLLSTVSQWYPDRGGFCSGALLLGFGTGGMVFGTLVGSLLDSIGWRATFLAIGIPIAAVCALAAFLIRAPRKEEVELLPTAGRETSNAATISYRTSQMVRTPQFWMFSLRSVLMVAVGVAIVGNAAPLALEFGASEGLAVLLASVISLANGLGRIVFGAVFDRLGRHTTLMLDGVLYLLAIAVLWLAGSTHSVPIIVVAVLVLGFAYGGIPSCNAAFILATFGQEDYASNFGAFNISCMFSSPVSQLIGGSLAARLGSYLATFPVLVGTASAALLLATLLGHMTRE